VTGNLLYFDRGTWQPTTLNMAIKDFCKVMYDEKQLWYKEWASRVTNRDVIKDQCIKNQGVGNNCDVSSNYFIVFSALQTVLLMETYTIMLRFGSSVPLISGRYTLRIRVFAIDQSGKKRPNDVCYEVRGTFFKI